MVKKAKKTVITEQVTTQPASKKQLSEEKTTAEVAKEEEAEFKGCVSLGTTRSSVTGRNKCGMAWKKQSKRSEFSRGPPIAYLKSMEEKARLKRIQERVARLREERKNSK